MATANLARHVALSMHAARAEVHTRSPSAPTPENGNSRGCRGSGSRKRLQLACYHHYPFKHLSQCGPSLLTLPMILRSVSHQQLSLSFCTPIFTPTSISLPYVRSSYTHFVVSVSTMERCSHMQTLMQVHSLNNIIAGIIYQS